MKLHSKDMGTVGEALVVAQVIENNNSAFPEFGDNSKVDLIVEDNNGSLHKVQVKTVSRLEKSPDTTQLYLQKSGPNYRFTYDENMLDWFAVVDFKTKQIAWVNMKWVLENCKSQLSLRHAPPKNGQKKNIWWFKDFTTYPFE